VEKGSSATWIAGYSKEMLGQRKTEVFKRKRVRGGGASILESKYRRKRERLMGGMFWEKKVPFKNSLGDSGRGRREGERIKRISFIGTLKKRS